MIRNLNEYLMDYTEKIERFIEGLMDEQEMLEFRKEMDADPELSRLVNDALRIQKTGEEIFMEGLDADPADLTSEIRNRTMQDIESYRKKSVTLKLQWLEAQMEFFHKAMPDKAKGMRDRLQKGES